MIVFKIVEWKALNPAINWIILISISGYDETNVYGRWIHTMSCQSKVQTYQF